MQVIGFVLAVISIVLINFEEEETTMKFKTGLILLLLVGGMADGMSKHIPFLSSLARALHKKNFLDIIH